MDTPPQLLPRTEYSLMVKLFKTSLDACITHLILEKVGCHAKDTAIFLNQHACSIKGPSSES